MSGKARPSLRAKALENVNRSNLSNTDKECIQAVFELAEKQKDEIDMLNNNISIMVATMSNSTKATKAEAYKEFAERVEPLKKFRSCMGNSVYELSVTMREIDDILKEMVGDNCGV